MKTFTKVAAAPSYGTLSEPRQVQSAAVRSGDGVLFVESRNRFKLGGGAREYLSVERGEGYIKWARGEIPFRAGDVFFADAVGEYEVYGVCAFAVVKERI